MAKRKTDYDYGECHICGDRMEPALISQDFWIKGELVVMESVPAGVCRQCGEKIVKADVGRAAAAMLAGPDRIRPERVLQVPVIKFGEAA